jgi:hypothetical protein
MGRRRRRRREKVGIKRHHESSEESRRQSDVTILTLLRVYTGSELREIQESTQIRNTCRQGIRRLDSYFCEGRQAGIHGQNRQQRVQSSLRICIKESRGGKAGLSP